MMPMSPDPFGFLADIAAATDSLNTYLAPFLTAVVGIASLICVVFLIIGAYGYITSSGKPAALASSKRVIINACLGLVIVLAAGTITAFLSHAYHPGMSTNASSLPLIANVKAAPVSNGLVDVVIKAITGVLNNIIQSIAEPFLKALSFFTSQTPLISSNQSVFRLWAVIVSMTDVLFVIVVMLLGFHLMSFASLGIEEIQLKTILPQIAVVFALINSSIFIIDGFISLSNAMIHAVMLGLGSITVWSVLTSVVKQSDELGLAALLIMICFLVFSVILLVYYVCRLVTLYVGAILAPLALLLWLIPSFRDFTKTASKLYLTTIFILFVHVVILELAASLFSGLATSSGSEPTNTLMALIVGLATLVALLKTQGLMAQLSYVSIGPRTARRLGGQFLTAVENARYETANIMRNFDSHMQNRQVGRSRQSLPSSYIKNQLSRKELKQGPAASGQPPPNLHLTPETTTIGGFQRSQKLAAAAKEVKK